MISFHSVNFSYTPEEPVFQNLNLEIPPGITTLVGQNGTGKSTLLLLAAGRLHPTNPEGTVYLLGDDTRSIDPNSLQKRASVVYQNMEFENEEPLGGLIEIVLDSGFVPQAKRNALYKEVLRVFELQDHLNKKTQNLSKGEMQRAVMAFSLLYGSQIIFMDEPVFALEDYQKHQCLDYISHYAKEENISFLYSAHELELSQKYSMNTLLFYKTNPPILGSSEELLAKEKLEEAYQIPFSMLKQKESLFRHGLEARNFSQENKDRLL
jgi:ABC-type cobalamin/Fe3+-siderophores transport system ATPase subunit